jgi:hypothetical protein
MLLGHTETVCGKVQSHSALRAPVSVQLMYAMRHCVGRRLCAIKSVVLVKGQHD